MPVPSEETELLRASAQRMFSQRRLRAGRSADLQTWRDLVELGWLSAHVPKDRGGLGLPMTDSLVLFEEAGRSLLVDPIIPGAAAAAALAQCATVEAESMLRRVLAGETICLLASETDCPVVNAARRAIGLAGDVAALILDGELAATTLIPSSCGRHLLVLDMAAADVQVHLAETSDGATVAMISADASAHPRWPIKPAEGIQCGDLLRLGYAAELVGLMDEALQRTVEYLTIRKQFGSPIGSFQAIQHRAASLYVELLACRSLVHEAGRAYGSARQSAAALMAKARASHASRNFLHECVQFHGAMGYAEEHDIGLYFRRAIALGAAGGATSECLALLGAAEENHR